MCTETVFYKGNNDFVLTSNRDEAPNRTALSPDFYAYNTSRLLLPKDQQSGGSWIGASNKNRVVCLLNGGFDAYKRKPQYRQSRGVVVTDLLSADAIEATIAAYNFKAIEPFTIVIADWNSGLKFYELVWDEVQTHFKQLPLETNIWSSSSLYNEEQKKARRQWFNSFKVENEINSASLLRFHNTAGKGDHENGVIMDRGFVKTTSITQIEKTNTSISMQFQNLNTTEVSVKRLEVSETID